MPRSRKVAYMLVVGQKEAEAGVVSVRHRNRGDLGVQPVADFLQEVLAKSVSAACECASQCRAGERSAGGAPEIEAPLAVEGAEPPVLPPPYGIVVTFMTVAHFTPLKKADHQCPNLEALH